MQKKRGTGAKKPKLNLLASMVFLTCLNSIPTLAKPRLSSLNCNFNSILPLWDYICVPLFCCPLLVAHIFFSPSTKPQSWIM